MPYWSPEESPYNKPKMPPKVPGPGPAPGPAAVTNAAGGGRPAPSYDAWEKQAKAKAGRDWNSRDARNQYEMFLLRREGKGGDVAGGARSSAISSGGPEDLARFDDATVAVWEKQKDPKCPPKLPYQAYDGSGCVGKPIDSNDPAKYGGWGGDAFSGRQLAASGGGGGAGGPGGPGGRMPGPGGAPGMDEASGTIWNSILERLKGGTRFTPEIMDQLMSNVKSGAERAAAAESKNVEADMARRGMSRSTIAGSAQRDIRSSLQGDVLQSQAQLARAKVDADFQDKTQAISDGMNWLNSLRSYVASMSATQAQKDVAMANIQLGYKTLTHQTNMMRENYAQELQRLGLQM